MNTNDLNRYHITLGPMDKEQYPPAQVGSTATLAEAWAMLMTQPLQDLVRSNKTGDFHGVPMCFQLYDQAVPQPLMSIVYASTFDSRVTLLNHASGLPSVLGLPFSDSPELKGEGLSLGNVLPGIGTIHFSEAYQQMATHAFQYYTNAQRLQRELPHRVVYDTLRPDGQKVHFGQEQHYFPTLPAAVLSMLTVEPGNVMEARLYPDSGVRCHNVELLEQHRSLPALKFQLDKNDQCFLQTDTSFDDLQHRTGINLSMFEDLVPLASRLHVGALELQGNYQLIARPPLRRFRYEVTTGVAPQHDTPEQQWRYRLMFQIPDQQHHPPTSNKWIRTHEPSAAAALERCLQVPLYRLHDHRQQSNAFLMIADQRGHSCAQIEMKQRQYLPDDSLQEAAFYLRLSKDYVDALPPQLQVWLTDQPMLLAHYTEGKAIFSAEALNMRAVLNQYQETQRQLANGVTFSEFNSLPSQDAAYTLQVHGQPVPYHHLEPLPSAVYKQYPVSDFGKALEVLSTLTPDWFTRPKPQPAGVDMTVKAVTLFTNRQRTPLMMVTVTPPSMGNQQLLMRIAKADLSTQETQWMGKVKQPVHGTAGWQVSFYDRLNHYQTLIDQRSHSSHAPVRSITQGQDSMQNKI